MPQSADNATRADISGAGERKSDRFSWTPVIAIGLGHGATHWLAAIFFIILPYIRADLGIDYTQAGFLVTVFYIAFFVTNFPSGVAVDLTGRHIFWQVTALSLGGLAMFAMGFAGSYLAIAAAAALIGATNVLWHPAAISYLSDMYPKRRGFVLSIHGMGASLGDAAGPLAAGALLVAMTWQGTAMSLAIVGPLVGLLIFMVVRNGGHRAEIERAPKRSYITDMFALIRRRAVWSLCLMAGLRSTAQLGLLTFLPLYLVDDLLLGPLAVGLVLMVLQLGGAVASPVAGAMSDRIGRRRVVSAGLTGSTVMILFLPFIENAVLFVTIVAILGFCLFAVRPVIHSWAMDMSPANLGGSMTSVLFGAQSSMLVFMPVVGGLIADAFGLLAVFYFITLIILLSNLAVFLIPREAARR